MRRGRLSLRWRVTTAFGVGSLLLITAIALATWHLATGYLLDQRQDSAQRQAQVNVRLVEQALRTRSEGLDELLTGLTTGPDSTILLHRPGQWITSGRQVPVAALPPPLITLAKRGASAQQRARVQGIPVLVVAIPVDTARDSYIELFPLLQLDQTFRFLSTLLVAAVFAAGVLGGALGAWTSRRRRVGHRTRAGDHPGRPADAEPDRGQPRRQRLPPRPRPGPRRHHTP